ncbi:MAG: hypothetical protein IPH07_36910 [Deltaproteobacteria bacterium]|nr:hypothetical protein [Deltaproteobacteria bacterium]MBK8713405.1 hypothetical protein [Deltaproteobacteria bacterium]MBP7288030.1 hypothetical protein [Nannocystaceae bacterium]
MHMHIPIRVALQLSLLPILGATACDTSERCFPVPSVAARRAEPEWDVQGITLQGIEGQGRALEGSKEQAPRLRDLDGFRFVGASVVLHGGRLVADGEEVRDAELEARSADGRTIAMRVGLLERPEGDRFAVSIDGSPLCAEGDEGVFVEGRWDERGAPHFDAAELTYACKSGVIAKCVAWGYAPWEVGAELHQSCTRLARADYCGDGKPWTLEGTRIDVYDTLGVQQPVHDPEMSFEAAWGPRGALCVAEARWLVEDDDGERVRPSCFATLPNCTSLTAATELGAMLANDSAHTPIPACE